MRRGEIWWGHLGKPFGSEPGFRRPVLVLQADEFNRSAIQTVIVVPLTSNLDRAGAPGNVVCRPRETGLSKPSVANVSQIATVDKRRLSEASRGTFPRAPFSELRMASALVLGL